MRSFYKTSKDETKIKIYVSNNPYGDEILLNVKDNINSLKSIDTEI